MKGARPRRRRRILGLSLLAAVLVAIAVPLVAKSSGLLSDGTPVRHLRVASVALQPDVDPAVNRRKIAAMVETVVGEHPDVDLVLFGEAILGWYSMGEDPRSASSAPGAPQGADTAAYQRRIAERIPGETSGLASRLAAEKRLYLCFGMTEESGGRVYNSQVLIDPSGSIVAVHRKVNVGKASVFQPGDVPATMADINGTRTAIIVCSDIQSGRVRARLRALQPELILGSLANPRDPGWFVAGVTARMFDAWIVTANRFGAEARLSFDGQMVVADPMGELRIRTLGREQYVFYDIGFRGQQSRAVGVLRSAYRGLSLAAHLVKGIGLLFASR